jgi:hypothetical protein
MRALHSQDEKPAGLAVTESTNFESAINLQTAQALGVKVSPGVLYIADEVSGERTAENDVWI